LVLRNVGDGGEEMKRQVNKTEKGGGRKGIYINKKKGGEEQ
jgi:hypothetical protein